MENEIKDLRNGNVSSFETKELLVRIFKYSSELLATMTDEQKEIFIRFQACLCEYSRIVDDAIFDHAFDLGMKTALEESE